jgi:hypothetical protein
MSNPPGTKLRRRGDRLIVTRGDQRMVFAPSPYKKARCLIEYSQTDVYHFTLTYGGDAGRFALASGTDSRFDDGGAEHVELVFDGQDGHPFRCRPAAIKVADGAWLFYETDGDDSYVSTSQTGITNAALLASSFAGRLDEDLAAFLGVNPTLCNVDDVEEFRSNHRYKALRDFKFQIAPPDKSIGKGRQAEAKFRHESTNYNKMLEAAGVDGLLWPETYEQVRKGVDRITKLALQESGGGES